MQNLYNELDPSQQMLQKALKKVEVSDRPSPPLEGTKTHSIKIPAQIAIDTNINAESLSAQVSDDLTIMQVASPLPQVEVGDKTEWQILPSSQASPPALDKSDARSGEVKRSESLSQPTPTVQAESLTPNNAQSSQDISKNLNTEGVTGDQNHNKNTIQYSDSAIAPTEQTIIQYSDSAIHNPAQTVYQAITPLSIDLDQTAYQLGRSQSPQSSTLATVPKNQAHIQLFHPSIFRDMFRASGSFASRFRSITEQFFHSIWRKIDLQQLRSRFYQGRQAVVKNLKQPTSSRINPSTPNAIASQAQPSLEQYQKKLRELDLCRLAFAKELARNGKLRDAIALAEQISQTSHFFKDAQKLIQSWK
ncbi:hypothetical protein [Chlorogloea sp. CCALA 695]|uniref:hypothetical protein n=1 Tax=Chlorogloea sp. CCALA 695 TaxID=2107693 RepID=UPI000D04FAB3|nr:hypothetical protein [Chlorogloea sp. CCALA 695]PSB28210.1 hypothetical protein C7B70_21335 [Chlorogloea sp. CCALA 695]